ncbi:MAG: SMC-Scp complex subunit ScpB [Coprococcus sp.]
MEDILKPEEAAAAIEAILFTMGEAVSAEAIGAAIGHDKETVIKIARHLMDRYRDEKRGVRIIELDGSFQMCTSPEMYDYVIRLTHQPKKQVLTDVMLETLAIVAYKQPVTRAEIEQIRGVSCSHAINKLLEYGLITEAGRLNAPGRPILFATTEDFLRTFGVTSAENLPSVSPEDMENLKTEAEEEVQMKLDI